MAAHAATAKAFFDQLPEESKEDIRNMSRAATNFVVGYASERMGAVNNTGIYIEVSNVGYVLTGRATAMQPGQYLGGWTYFNSAEFNVVTKGVTHKVTVGNCKVGCVVEFKMHDGRIVGEAINP